MNHHADCRPARNAFRFFAAERLVPCGIFVGLVALGAIGRHLFPDIPNFTPTAAVALFAGFYFRRLTVALAVPLLALAISNIWLPAYGDFQTAAAVYLLFFLPVLLPRCVRGLPGWAQGPACGLAPATAFFLLSNLAVWAGGMLYERTASGLLECYLLALPFYRTMLAGDLLYGGLLFGGYAAARIAAGYRGAIVRGTTDKRVVPAA